MIFNNLVIEAYGIANPPIVKTSEDIENEISKIYEKFKLSNGRLELMTGIRERRFYELGMAPSSISTIAAENLFEKFSIDRESIELLIHSGVCRDFLEPATASVIHQNLNLSPLCQIFDLSNACLGFLNSITMAGNLIENKVIKRALIVTGENGYPLIHETLKRINNDTNIDKKTLKKYFANLTIGSAGVAFVLTHKDYAPNAPQILGGSTMTDSSANHLCRGDGNTHGLMMETDSEELMHKGLELAKNNFNYFLKNLNINLSDIHGVLTHQVGSAHEKLSLESVNLQDKKTYRTYPTFGNTGSAALPLTIVRAMEENIFSNNDLIALLGIGSGLSSIMLGLKWKKH